MPGNGCGPSWMPRWIKSALFDWFFEASCARHDEGYEEGGTEARRLHCDRRFLQAMLSDVKRVNIVLRPLAAAEAILFYAAVRLLGWTSFNYL